jgi:hypothetical protein
MAFSLAKSPLRLKIWNWLTSKKMSRLSQKKTNLGLIKSDFFECADLKIKHGHFKHESFENQVFSKKQIKYRFERKQDDPGGFRPVFQQENLTDLLPIITKR